MQTEATELVERIHRRFLEVASFDSQSLEDSRSKSQDLKSIIHTEGATFEQTIRTRVEAEFFGWGPMEQFFQDESVSEIIVNGPNNIWIERGGRLAKTSDRFLSEVTYRNFILRIAQEIGSNITLDHPFASGQVDDYRIQILAPPVVPNYQLTIRRHPKCRWTLDSLLKDQFLSQQQANALRSLITEKKTLLIAGSTGAGKTTLLNACLQELDETERVIILEDTAELKAPNEASVAFLTRHDAQGVIREVTLSDLLRHALRMRPDRIAVGEVRGGEAKDLLMALATGHGGSFGTLHAESAREVLLRLEMLIQLGAPQWNRDAIRQLISLSVHNIAIVERTTSEVGHSIRRLKGIWTIASLEENGITLEQLA